MSYDSKEYYISKWHVLEYIRKKKQVRVRDVAHFFKWDSGFATRELQILTNQRYLKRVQQENNEAPYYELGEKAGKFLKECCGCYGMYDTTCGFLDERNKYLEKSKELAKHARVRIRKGLYTRKEKMWIDYLRVL